MAFLEDAVNFYKAAEREPDPDDRGEGNEKAPGGSSEETAQSAPVPTEKAEDNPKSLFWDPFAIIEQLGYKERPSQISYGTLRAIVWKLPIIQAIIQTRINQIVSFCSPQHNRYELGFRIKMRNHEDKPTAADKKFSRQMESFIMRTGVTDNPRGRDGFEQFVRKFIWDSMVYDQACMEVVPNRKGQPAEWYAVDSSSMRLADTARTYMDEDLRDTVKFVQVYDSMIVAEYTQEELAFGIRNPRSDMRLHGYGVSEIEMLMSAVTSLLYAWDYNTKFFSQGTSAKGLLNFKGAVSEAQMRAFRRHWYQMVTGVENAWRTPITNAEEVQWVNMQQSNRDMEFNAWMDFLIKVSCGIYSMDPIELNFKYGNVGQKGALSEGNNKEKLTESKERGLRPLLRFLASVLNLHVVWPINENFEFAFVGLDAFTREEAADMATKQVKSFRTIDEIRAEDDLPSLADGTGNLILDPTYLQYLVQQQQAKQQTQQGGMPGQEGVPQGPDGQPDFQQMLAGKTGQPGQQASGEPEELNTEAPKPEAGQMPPNPIQKSYRVDIRL